MVAVACSQRDTVCPPQSNRIVKPANGAIRWLYLTLAVVCIGLGMLGIVLPGLPTTPFVLLAAWAAARSSPRLHAWLFNHRWLGPPLRNWDRERAIATRSKLLAVALLISSWCILAWYSSGLFVPVLTGLLFIAVATFLVTRPAPRTPRNPQSGDSA